MAEYLASVQDDDDDDDEDEAEFQPGMDDDEDDDDDDDDELPPSDDDDDAEQWKGVLCLQKDGKLGYSGGSSENYSFALETAEALSHWNWEAPTATTKEGGASRMRTLVLVGSVGLSTTVSMDLTITATNKQGVSSSSAAAASGAMKLSDDDDGGGKQRAGKSTGEEDGGGKHRSVAGIKSAGDDDGGGKQRAGCKSTGEDDGKKRASKPAAAASQVFTVFGRGPGWEIYGDFSSPSSTTNNGSDAGSVDLVCRYQTVAAAAGAAGAGAAAAKVEDDDDVDVDEGVDYNELIALHEDAGMPVTEVRKRYRSSDSKEVASADAKRTKTVSDEDDDDDHDDDDIGF
eukprot:CAMPEP_0119007034 /NCGR_PEP_ID=MMETSP1176-20130426/2721_1 /TAXON_ID=265551 /ORGANISM="Synedropsis recta cf, Strain CCMP1620" /LENGTH=343 /DNA_ID=CAMNT_0006959093 /DNA_START=110 /DNA_END=1141 /DNA_ORIENTATION=-